jgi:hypothetical protein
MLWNEPLNTNDADGRFSRKKHQSLSRLPGEMCMKNVVYIFGVYFLILWVCEKNAISPPAESLNSSRQGLLAKTDTTVYLINGDAVVQVRVRILNHTDSIAYFSHCGGLICYTLQKKDNNVWQDEGGWGFPCLAIYSMGIKQIKPDSSYLHFMHLNQIGTYRLLIPFGWVTTTASWTDSLYSNEFHVQSSLKRQND